MLLLLACTSTPPAVAVPPPSPPPAPLDYDTAKEDLAADRQDLAERHRAGEEVGDEARARLLTALREELIPPWLGTTWGFYGTSEVPGEGEIACGYFVSTVLRDAGLRVERVKLAQQASEHILRSFTPDYSRHYGHTSVERVLQDVDRDGVYIVGLDYHVGLLLRREQTIDFCHSSVWAPGTVVCEEAATALGLESGYHVVGEILTDAVLEAWLEEEAIPTFTP